MIKTGDGKIYAGTADGIVRFEGNQLIHYSDEKGYITLGKSDEPIINPEGIKNYEGKQYSYLLPYPDQSRDEYHAGSDWYFYICSGGQIFIYDIVPYVYSYPHHSIRSISEHFVGTYSGIYFNGKLQNNIYRFTDGYIREIDGKAFVCYDGLAVVDSLQHTLSHSIDSISKSQVHFTYVHPSRDILKINNDTNYILASTNKLYTISYNGREYHPFYSANNKSGELNILGCYRNGLLFSDSNYLINTNKFGGFDTLTQCQEVILDGDQDVRNFYFLTSVGLYVYNTDKTIKLLTKLFKAHTIQIVNSSEIAISTDNGLFVFNTVTNTLNTLIPGVEFNRRALYLKEGNLYAGSINGLYTIHVNDFEVLVQRNKASIKKEWLPTYFIVMLLLIGLITIYLVVVLMKVRKKLTTAQTQIKTLSVETPKLDREQIELFIRENLANASLKSIADHFNTSNRSIYKLIEPDKPGLMIQNIRLETVREMTEEGRDLTEIAEATGLSESYIKKIRGTI